MDIHSGTMHGYGLFRFMTGLLLVLACAGCWNVNSSSLDGSDKEISYSGGKSGGRPYYVRGRKYSPLLSANGFYETGMASWYGSKFHGRRTASGERYNMYAMTAAHKLLPFNTTVRVTNLRNGKSVVVRVNDRGPFSRGRVIDLSLGAARRLGIEKTGVARVRIEAVAPR